MEALHKQYLPKLQEITFCAHFRKSIDWKKFSHIYHKQIKRLSFVEKYGKKSYPEFWRFENPESLKIDSKFLVLDNELIAMARNCKNLKRLAFIGRDLNTNCKNLMGFENLKSLDLNLNGFKNINVFNDLTELNLTQLSIESPNINKDFLRKLIGMKDLRKLIITSNGINHSEIIELIEKSPKICEIQLNSNIINKRIKLNLKLIKEKINALIVKAKKDPKTLFKLIVNDIENYRQLKRITGADIPENLLIQSLENIEIIGKTSKENLLFFSYKLTHFLKVKI